MKKDQLKAFGQKVYLEWAKLGKKVSEKYEADIFVYNGAFYEPFDYDFYKLCNNPGRKKNAYLILYTYGGDPNVAYRIGSFLQQFYEKLYICIPFKCRSAGTILTIAADSIIMFDTGDIGPIDVQMLKPDEIGERDSGLTLMKALETIKTDAIDTVVNAILSLRNETGFQISTKAAIECSHTITIGLFGELFAQIDPMRLGETIRSLQLGKEYAIRLNYKPRNLKSGAIERLVNAFPSHTFIINRKEAEGLFEDIHQPETIEIDLIDSLGTTATTIGYNNNNTIYFKVDINYEEPNKIGDSNGQPTARNTAKKRSGDSKPTENGEGKRSAN